MGNAANTDSDDDGEADGPPGQHPVDVAQRCRELHGIITQLLSDEAKLARECDRLMVPLGGLPADRIGQSSAEQDDEDGEEDSSDELSGDEEGGGSGTPPAPPVPVVPGAAPPMAPQEPGAERRILPSELRKVTQCIIDRLGCRHPATLQRVSAVYAGFAGRRDGLTNTEFRGYVACILTQFLRELETRCAAAGMRITDQETKAPPSQENSSQRPSDREQLPAVVGLYASYAPDAWSVEASAAGVVAAPSCQSGAQQTRPVNFAPPNRAQPKMPTESAPRVKVPPKELSEIEKLTQQLDALNESLSKAAGPEDLPGFFDGSSAIEVPSVVKEVKEQPALSPKAPCIDLDSLPALIAASIGKSELEPAAPGESLSFLPVDDPAPMESASQAPAQLPEKRSLEALEQMLQQQPSPIKASELPTGSPHVETPAQPFAVPAQPFEDWPHPANSAVCPPHTEPQSGIAMHLTCPPGVYAQAAYLEEASGAPGTDLHQDLAVDFAAPVPSPPHSPRQPGHLTAADMGITAADVEREASRPASNTRPSVEVWEHPAAAPQRQRQVSFVMDYSETWLRELREKLRSELQLGGKEMDEFRWSDIRKFFDISDKNGRSIFDYPREPGKEIFPLTVVQKASGPTVARPGGLTAKDLGMAVEVGPAKPDGLTAKDLGVEAYGPDPVQMTSAPPAHAAQVEAPGNKSLWSRVKGAGTSIASGWKSFADTMDGIFVPENAHDAASAASAMAPEAPGPAGMHAHGPQAMAVQRHEGPTPAGGWAGNPGAASATMALPNAASSTWGGMAPVRPDVPVMMRPPSHEDVRELLEEQGLGAFMALGGGRGFVPKRICLDSSGSTLYVLEEEDQVPSVFFGLDGFDLRDLQRIAHTAVLAPEVKPMVSLEFQEGYLMLRLQDPQVLFGLLGVLTSAGKDVEVIPRADWS